MTSNRNKNGRWRSRLVLFLLVAGVLMGGDMSSPQEAQAQPCLPYLPCVCDLIPNETAKKACRAGTGDVAILVPDAVDAAKSGVEAVASFSLRAALEELVELEIRANIWLIKEIASLVGETTSPDLAAVWYNELYMAFFAVGMILAFTVLMVGLLKDAADSNVKGFIEKNISYVIFAVLALTLPGLVAAAVLAFDQKAAPAMMESALEKFEASSAANPEFDFSTPGGAAEAAVAILAPALMLLVSVIGGAIMWFMFYGRELFLYVIVILEMFSWALFVQGRTSWDRFMRTTMTLISLIMFQFYAALLFYIGVWMWAEDTGGSAAVLSSLLLILMPVGVWVIHKAVSGYKTEQAPHYAMAIASGGYKAARVVA